MHDRGNRALVMVLETCYSALEIVGSTTTNSVQLKLLARVSR